MIHPTVRRWTSLALNVSIHEFSTRVRFLRPFGDISIPVTVVKSFKPIATVSWSFTRPAGKRYLHGFRTERYCNPKTIDPHRIIHGYLSDSDKLTMGVCVCVYTNLSAAVRHPRFPSPGTGMGVGDVEKYETYKLRFTSPLCIIILSSLAKTKYIAFEAALDVDVLRDYTLGSHT